MSKNEKFHRVYTLDVSGISNNKFMLNVFHGILDATIKAFNYRYKQTNVLVDYKDVK